MSAPWRVVFTNDATARLRRLPVAAAVRVAEPIAALASDPFPSSSRKAVGTDYWGIRVGDIRVLYALDEKQRVVIVLRVARRAESAYRRLPT